MSTFLIQLKWQVVLLHKNNIIVISFAITLISGLVLFFFKDMGNLDMVLVTLILNDPSVIGYFFIALSIYTEIKYQVLPAIFVTPVNIHLFLIARTLAISVIGTICSLLLAFSVKGLNFSIAHFTTGAFGICILSALVGLTMLTFASEFIRFAMLSIPVFLTFINIPLLQYLEVFDMGFAKYLFPAQGSIDLIDFAISKTSINFWYSYLSILTMVPVFYWIAFKRFTKKIVQQ